MEICSESLKEEHLELIYSPINDNIIRRRYNNELYIRTLYDELDIFQVIQIGR